MATFSLWPPSTEEEKRFTHKMSKALQPVFLKSIVPLFMEKDSLPVQCGTGTLFKVADQPFIVTAAHVTDFCTKDGYKLFVTDEVEGSRCIPIEGEFISDRKYDIAIVAITRGVAENLSNRRFLTVQNAQRAPTRAGRGYYFIHGFPNCWTQAKPSEISVTRFTYGTVLYEGPTDGLSDYEVNSHILVRVCSVNKYADETKATLPAKLHGISGCSIWRAFYEHCPSDGWTADDAVIVAVQTGVYEKTSLIKGTYWAVVDDILRIKFPNLRPALNLVVPRRHLR